MTRRGVDRTSQRFGSIVVTKRVPHPACRRWHWEYECDCGNIGTAGSGEIHNKTSCPECSRTRQVRTKHGLRNTPEYAIWSNMKQRCLNENHANWADYGGRGIKVCDRWLDSVEAFYKDMGPRPSADLTVERYDVDGDYCPENCGWETVQVQQNNRRSSHLITWNGEVKSMKDWCRALDIPYARTKQRIAKGWEVGEAFTTPTVPRCDRSTYRR